jgi:hypothetical protein
MKRNAMEYKDPKISVYNPIGGYNSILTAIVDNEGFRDVIQTGMGPYRTRKQAEQDAECWSKAEGIPYDR